jgi:hypothetical protein
MHIFLCINAQKYVHFSSKPGVEPVPRFFSLIGIILAIVENGR